MEALPQETVKVRGLTKRYGKVLAINDLNLTLYEGDLFGFIGPNGAGKTTTLRILATTLSADSGEVFIAGHSLPREVEKVRAIIGFMPDFLGIYDDIAVRDYLEFFARAYHLPPHLRNYAIEEVSTLTRIAPLLGLPVESLSRGMKQRLGLAKTLLHNPRVILLDEPASGLDPKARVELRDIIKGLQKQGRTIIISSHILSDLADLCNKVGIIEKGKMLLVEETESLLRKISTGLKRLKLRTLGNHEELSRILGEYRDVSGIEWDGEDLIITFSGSDRDLSELLRYLIEKELPLYSFSEIQGSLESAYMKIIEGAGEAPALCS
ncbi:MAG: ABC transporter ATP-binding protein [Candidatus Eremiobacteraeota bacterium]|nr:ABC transporter ATP-binding protein [Candidatus Eremiobacteraeota bacterium]